MGKDYKKDKAEVLSMAYQYCDCAEYEVGEYAETTDGEGIREIVKKEKFKKNSPVNVYWFDGSDRMYFQDELKAHKGSFVKGWESCEEESTKQLEQVNAEWQHNMELLKQNLIQRACGILDAYIDSFNVSPDLWNGKLKDNFIKLMSK